MVRQLLRTIALLAACTGCSDAGRTDEAESAPTPAATGDRPRLTLDQFRGLHFLAGNWKGTMPNGSHFFESYRLLNDSTIQMYAHADSTFGAPSDSSRVYISAGTIYNGPQAAVDLIDENGFRFTSTGSPRYVYVWKSTGPNSWTATLGADASTVYQLTRVGT